MAKPDDNHPITIWITTQPNPHEARFARQNVWLHTDGSTLNRAWRSQLILEQAEAAGIEPDFSAKRFAALYHIKNARILPDSSDSLESLDVDDGDTFLLLTSMPSSFESLAGYFRAARFPKNFDVRLPDYVEKTNWQEIVEYKTKKEARMPTTVIKIRDIHNSIVPILSNLAGAQQIVGSLPTASADQKAQLNSLLNNLQSEILQTPADKQSEAEALTECAKQMVGQAAKPQPNPTMLQIMAQSLQTAAGFLKDVVPPVATISDDMVHLIGQLHNIPI